MARLVVGTRGSALALWQARHVVRLLRARHPDLDIEERVIQTEGDLDDSSAIPRLGTTGVFVRRLEQALLAGDIDIAVHSLKDLPSDQPTGLLVAAVPERHDPRDALVSVRGFRLAELPPGTVLGTGSVRRRCQLLHARPDLRIEPLRGNVDTRVGKVRQGEIGAAVLALAGLVRLGIDGIGIRALETDQCLPAVGQGALAIEARVEDRATRELVEPLSHPASLHAVTAERAFLRRLGGGCQAPAAAYARVEDARLVVEAVVGEPDGGAVLSERDTGPVAQAHEIGARIAERLIVAGARRILDAAREAPPSDV